MKTPEAELAQLRTNNSRYSIAVNIDRELQVVILANLEGQ